jgi:hypothetical protein
MCSREGGVVAAVMMTEGEGICFGCNRKEWLTQTQVLARGRSDFEALAEKTHAR